MVAAHTRRAAGADTLLALLGVFCIHGGAQPTLVRTHPARLREATKVAAHIRLAAGADTLLALLGVFCIHADEPPIWEGTHPGRLREPTTIAAHIRPAPHSHRMSAHPDAFSLRVSAVLAGS